VLLLGRLSEGGPVGMKIGDRVGASPGVEEPLAPAGAGGGLVFLPFPLFRRLEPKGGTEGSIWYSCNMTGHVTRKSRDSVRGVSESANCTWRENRGEEACVSLVSKEHSSYIICDSSITRIFRKLMTGVFSTVITYNNFLPTPYIPGFWKMSSTFSR